MGAYERQLDHDKRKLTEALREAEDELKRRRRADARLRALHQPYRSVYDTDGNSCSHCNAIGSYAVPYPCPTITALNGDPT